MSVFENLLADLDKAASHSVERFADQVRDLIQRPPLDEVSKNDSFEVVLPRLFSDVRLRAYRPRLAAALTFGARTWDFDSDREAFVAAQLFRELASPILSATLAIRLLSPPRVARGLTVNNSYTDQLVEAVLASASDGTVRARLVDLVNDDRYQRFAIVVFLRVAKIDSSSVRLFIGPALDVARAAIQRQPFNPPYIVGFDRELNRADIVAIVRDIDTREVRAFTALFLARSRRFTLIQSGSILNRQIGAQASRVPAGEIAIVDELAEGVLPLPRQAQIFGGALDNARAAPLTSFEELTALGLLCKPLFDKIQGNA